MTGIGSVVIELRGPSGWRAVGSVSEVEPPGSISSDEPDGRQVYVFGWLPDGTGPGVWRARAGVDVENEAFREITTTALDRLADLAAGPYAMAWQRPSGVHQIRFQCVVGGDAAARRRQGER